MSICNLRGVAGSYVDYTCTSTSNRSDVNMEHGDSQGSNDTIKIPFQFKPKVRPLPALVDKLRQRFYVQNQLAQS